MGKVSPKKKGQQEDQEELVLTPGGWRPKSKVYYVEPGYHIDGEGGRLKIVHTATGKVIADLGEIQPEEPLKPKKRKSGAGKSAEKTSQPNQKQSTDQAESNENS
jgi:hypothetical protein